MPVYTEANCRAPVADINGARRFHFSKGGYPVLETFFQTVHHQTPQQASARNQAIEDQKNRCLSCGTTEGMNRRRYCSIDCRKRLRHALNIRTGLLRALNVRYAVFHFTDGAVVMDVIPYGCKEVYRFIANRKYNQLPADDFRRMADDLGKTWWEEKRRTNRRYLASLLVFKKATVNGALPSAVCPIEIRVPAVKPGALSKLKLDRQALASPGLRRLLKTAYRLEAKRNHPDHGGDPALFRKIHEAYEELVFWAQNPTYRKRRGFSEKWFYDGGKNKWIQPIPFD